jgi:precorrin-6x reductase
VLSVASEVETPVLRVERPEESEEETPVLRVDSDVETPLLRVERPPPRVEI